MTLLYIFVGMNILGGLAYLYFLVTNNIIRRKELIFYTQRIEPIFCYASSPYDDVVEEKNYHLEQLKKAGNNNNVSVYAFYFKTDPGAAGETWEEYQERVRFSVNAFQNAFLTELQQKNPVMWEDLICRPRPENHITNFLKFKPISYEKQPKSGNS